MRVIGALNGGAVRANPRMSLGKSSGARAAPGHTHRKCGAPDLSQ